MDDSGGSQYVLCLGLLFKNVLFISLCVSHICDSTPHHVTGVWESFAYLQHIVIYSSTSKMLQPETWEMSSDSAEGPARNKTQVTFSSIVL